MSGAEEQLRRAQAIARRETARGKRYTEWFKNTAVGRAFDRFIDYNGNVLAGGIAYYSLASIGAAVVLLASIASYIVVVNEDYKDAIIEFVSEAIPGIISDGEGGPGLIDPSKIEPTSFSGVLGLIAFGVLLWTATRYLRGMRTAVKSMLGDAAGTKIPGTLGDIIALISLAVIAVVATALQIIGGALASWFADLVGGGELSAWLVRVAALTTGLIANALFATLVFVVLGQAKVPFRILAPTIGLVAISFSVMQQASGWFVASASSNAVLAPFAAVIALLLFVDFTARVILVAAAWLGGASGGLGGVGHVELSSPARRRRGGVTTVRAMATKTYARGEEASRAQQRDDAEARVARPLRRRLATERKKAPDRK